MQDPTGWQLEPWGICPRCGSGRESTVKKFDVTALSPHRPIPANVIEFVRGVAELWEQHLGERLTGIYLIGSLAHGGYSSRYSDIDLALISKEPLIARDHDLIAGRIAQQAPGLASKLSLFWADEAFSTGRLPPLDRIDYLDYGVPLLQRRHVLPKRPTRLEVRSYLMAEPLRKWSREAMRLSSLQELRPEDHKAYLRALLYPARFIYSWQTGTVASNDDAVDFVARHKFAGPGIDLITRAVHCRNAGADPSDLFMERHTLPTFVGICRERVEATSRP